MRAWIGKAWRARRRDDHEGDYVEKENREISLNARTSKNAQYYHAQEEAIRGGHWTWKTIYTDKSLSTGGVIYYGIWKAQNAMMNSMSNPACYVLETRFSAASATSTS